MSNTMPGFIDPYIMAKRHQSLQGSIPLLALTRLCESLADTQGELQYSLHFDTDEDGVCFVSGELQANLALRCQRCLQIFRQELKSDFKVSPVVDDAQAKLLASEYEPVIVVDGKLIPLDLIEDELILAMPIVARHDVENCFVKSDIDKTQDLLNPFRVLVQKIGDKNGGTTES